MFGRILVAALVLLTGPALAQVAPAPRPGWLPARVTWNGPISPADRAAAMAVLRRIEARLLEIPELATPDGFEIAPIFSGGLRTTRPDGTPLPNAVVGYFLGLMIHAPSRKLSSEGCTCISIVVNDVPPPAKHRGEDGLPMYFQTELLGTPIPGATEVWGELLDIPNERSFLDAVFTTGGELPWKPVTREAFTRALLFETDGAGGAKTAELQAAFAKTPYQEWVEGAAERKKVREETLRDAATVQSAAEVAKTRAALEASERDVTERLKAGDAAARQQFAAARSNAASVPADLHATLEGMTPTERRMAAVIDNARDTGPLVAGYRLSDGAGRSAWPVRTPDLAFWRARRSPVEVRSIRVHIGISTTGLRPKVQRALLATFQKLDWATFNQLLESPRPGAAK